MKRSRRGKKSAKSETRVKIVEKGSQEGREEEGQGRKTGELKNKQPPAPIRLRVRAQVHAQVSDSFPTLRMDGRDREKRNQELREHRKES